MVQFLSINFFLGFFQFFLGFSKVPVFCVILYSAMMNERASEHETSVENQSTRRKTCPSATLSERVVCVATVQQHTSSQHSI